MPHGTSWFVVLARSAVMSFSVTGDAYGVLVPVKPTAVAKSRLLPLGDPFRTALAVSFVVDTVTAVLATPQVSCVLVVSDDHELARGLSALGAEVVPDGAGDDLNASLLQAAAELRRRHGDLRIAALCADLPALRSEQLSRALLAAADDQMSFVADTERVGTTACMAPDVDLFRPRFGPASRQRHLEAGAIEIDLPDIETLRRDVDTPADLAAARDLGVGARTAVLVTALRL